MMRPGHCEEMLQEFCAYLDGQLPSALCARIEAHLAECEDCTAMVNTLRKTIELYKRWRIDGPVPEDVRRRLYETLNLPDRLRG
jgi:anti-sigma factor RsiW